MSRSRKKNPFYALNNHYKIRNGKKNSRRKFRSKSMNMLRTGRLDLMPLKIYEVSEIWDITDGKIYCHHTFIDERIRSVLRK